MAEVVSYTLQEIIDSPIVDKYSGERDQQVRVHKLLIEFENINGNRITNFELNVNGTKTVAAKNCRQFVEYINRYLQGKSINAVVTNLNNKGNAAALHDMVKIFERQNILTLMNASLSDIELTAQKTVSSAQSGTSQNGSATSGTTSNVETIVADAIENSEKNSIIFTGAPGTGKTYSVENYVKDVKERSGFVQFHSSFDYTDFVEGLRPVSDGNVGMKFVRMDGIFKKFCRRALKNPDETYYFIIDEINRADLSRVFGELMYCFEKRGTDHKVDTQYQNLPTYEMADGTAVIIENDDFAGGFYVPENVIVIGTMNDIDRSVETFDFALRRRFDWVNIKANDVMESSLISMRESGTIDAAADDANLKQLSERVVKMNGKISDKQYSLNEDYHIGPAYFKGYNGTKESLTEIFEHNIAPILQEYLRGRATKLVEGFTEACKNALFATDSVSGDQQ